MCGIRYIAGAVIREVARRSGKLEHMGPMCRDFHDHHGGELLHVYRWTAQAGKMLYFAKKATDVRALGKAAPFLSYLVDTRGGVEGNCLVRYSSAGKRIWTSVGKLAMWNEVNVAHREAVTGLAPPTQTNLSKRVFTVDRSTHVLDDALGPTRDYSQCGIVGLGAGSHYPLPCLEALERPTREALALPRYIPHAKAEVALGAGGEPVTFEVPLGLPGIDLVSGEEGVSFPAYALVVSDPGHATHNPKAGFAIVNRDVLARRGLSQAVMRPSALGRVTLRDSTGTQRNVSLFRAAALALHFHYVSQHHGLSDPSQLHADHVDNDPWNNSVHNVALLTQSANASAPRRPREKGSASISTDFTDTDRRVVQRLEWWDFQCDGALGMKFSNTGLIMRANGTVTHGWTSGGRSTGGHYAAIDATSFPPEVQAWMAAMGVPATRKVYIHRLLWVLYNKEPIPPGCIIAHATRTWRGPGHEPRRDGAGRVVVPSYPQHLSAKTRSENARERIADGLQQLHTAHE